MFRFRKETWGKKIDHARAWSTCYSDVIRGYGKFLGNNLIHLRRVPKRRHGMLRQLPSLPGPVGPRIDHMWEALPRKGIAAFGNSRQNIVKEQRHKAGDRGYKAGVGQAKDPRVGKVSASRNQTNSERTLPPLQLIKHGPKQADGITLNGVVVSIPGSRRRRKDRFENTNSNDVMFAPAVGLPTSCDQKLMDNTKVPRRLNDELFRSSGHSNLNPITSSNNNRSLSNSEVSTQTSPPPSGRDLFQTPSIHGLTRDRVNGSVGSPDSIMLTLSPRKPDYTLPDVNRSRPSPDISLFVDRALSPLEKPRRFTFSTSYKPTATTK